MNSQYSGLRAPQATLPAYSYFDPAYHQRELHSIWYQSWIYVCRSEDLASTGDYRTVSIGTQNLIVLRDEHDTLRGFHNTCRHRGSILLTAESGNLGAGQRLSCPYHRWAYSLQGNLLSTGVGTCPAGFKISDYPLHCISVEEWSGFVFVNVQETPAESLVDSFDEFSVSLENWPLTDVRRGHVYEKTLDCNWKVFWENFNECLHCPSGHPGLCQIVPLYKRGIMEPFDDPAWQPDGTALDSPKADPAQIGGLKQGAHTWSHDGVARGDWFPKLTAAEISTGHHYVMVMPSMFIVAHVNYVRTMQVLPLGPEQTRLRSDWYFQQSTLDDPEVDVAEIASFARQVIDEDGALAELNQRGLHSIAHTQGTLMAEEYDVSRFQDWVRQKVQPGTI